MKSTLDLLLEKQILELEVEKVKLQQNSEIKHFHGIPKYEVKDMFRLKETKGWWDKMMDKDNKKKIFNKILESLNGILKTDPPTVLELLFINIELCNERLSKHPYVLINNTRNMKTEQMLRHKVDITVAENHNKNYVRSIDLLNGIIEPLTGKRITLDTTGEQAKFIEYNINTRRH